jgi:hypothetical protein
LGGDRQVEGDGLGDDFAGGGAGGDLILVGAGRGAAEVEVASTAAAGEEERCGGEEDCPEDWADAVGVGFSGLSYFPEEEEGRGEEAEEGLVGAVSVG